jgi:hypothetical protein
MAAEFGHEPNRAYFDQAGNIHLNGAALFDANEVPIAGAGSGLKLARGQQNTVTAVDTVATGLTTVVAAVASLDSDPGDDPMLATASIGDQAGAPVAGSILVKTWKNTGGTDPTPLAASTFGKKVNWIAIGT